MKLKGSCHCGNVRFQLESKQPWPYLRCYCEICRKTSGGGGYSINLGGDAATLTVEGSQNVKIYRAMIERNGSRVQSEHERHFCAQCGSHLWAQNPNWPSLVHPVAGAIDNPLPPAPSNSHMMVASAASWTLAAGNAADNAPSAPNKPVESRHEGYPDLSLADWHSCNHYRDPQ